MSHTRFKHGDRVETQRYDDWHVIGYSIRDPPVVIVEDRHGDIDQFEEVHLRLYKEPVKVVGWVNVNSNGFTRFFETREEADSNSGINRTACVYVTGTEGDEPA